MFGSSFAASLPSASSSHFNASFSSSSSSSTSSTSSGKRKEHNSKEPSSKTGGGLVFTGFGQTMSAPEFQSDRSKFSFQTSNAIKNTTKLPTLSHEPSGPFLGLNASNVAMTKLNCENTLSESVPKTREKESSSSIAMSSLSHGSKHANEKQHGSRTHGNTDNVDAKPISSSSFSSKRNATHSVECCCLSTDGRAFHSYLNVEGNHVIVTELAPFREQDDVATNNNNSHSSIKITTNLPTHVQQAISIDPVVGFLCVDGAMDNPKQNKHLRRTPEGETLLWNTLPWMCLYTRASAFLFTIGYPTHEEGDGTINNIQGEVLHLLEPFEKHLLMAPRGSSILRIRSAPIANTILNRCGSMAMMMREGGEGNDREDFASVGYVVALYHGLPESLLNKFKRNNDVHKFSSSIDMGGSFDMGAMCDVFTESSVTTPLRFNYHDLVRGMEYTEDAENEAYNLSSLRQQHGPLSSSQFMAKKVIDFCFLCSSSSAGSGASEIFASISILVLCNDGSVYGASPLIFDGTALPRSMIVDTISQLDAEIDASIEAVASHSSSNTVIFEQEKLEARIRQCKAAKRYLLDAFRIPEGGITPSSAQDGSFYASASIVYRKSLTSAAGGPISQALAWQTRLQGPLVLPPSQIDTNRPSCTCIEPFGGIDGSGIIHGFVVARASHTALSSSTPIFIDFGFVPGEGTVLLPRFEFESDHDCQLLSEIVSAAGLYIEHASIMRDKIDSEKAENTSNCLSIASSRIGRSCTIVADPLDDFMVHVLTNSLIFTVSTNALAVTAQYLQSALNEGMSSEEKRGNIADKRTTVWSGLEVSSNAFVVVGAGVSSDVHLGHILLAKISNGTTEVVNVTAAQCIHEASLLIESKLNQVSASQDENQTLATLKNVKPLNVLLQPLIDQLCNGLSKMGKIVGSATLPKDAMPENLAVFLETRRSCELNILMPMEEMSSIICARGDLLKEMYEVQASELERLGNKLDEFKKKYESNLKRVQELNEGASALASRSSAVLTATRDLRPQISEAEAAYFKEIQLHEVSCNKWDENVKQIQKDALISCEAMSAGAIENGDVCCLVDLPPDKIDLCHQMLQGEEAILKKIEKNINNTSTVLKKLSTAILGLNSADPTHLQLIAMDKENVKTIHQQ